MTHQRTQRAFTLVELFVVIAVTLVAIAAALPAFNAMTQSSKRSLAENTLKVAVTMARDVMMQSGRSADGAAVFLFDPESQRIRIIAAEYVGTITDVVDGNLNLPIERDVFVPVLTADAPELPTNWMVRGFAPARFALASGGPGVGFDWYDSDLYADGGAWDRGHWVFPEDGFYDLEGQPGTPGARVRSPRQSFMIRFDGRTGQLRRDARESLLVYPRPSSQNRSTNLASYGAIAGSRTDSAAWLRVDWADDLRAWASRVVNDPDLNGNGVPYQVADQRLRRAVIGNESLDTVLLSDVSQVALYDERELVGALGGSQLTRREAGSVDTGSLYKEFDPAAGLIQVDFEGLLARNAAFTASSAGYQSLRSSVDNWIDGNTNRMGNANSFTLGNPTLFDGPDHTDGPDEPKALRYVVDPFSGELTEVIR